MLKMTLPRALLALSLLATPLIWQPRPAAARDMCGLPTFLDELKAGTKYKTFSSMCLAFQGCSIFSNPVMGHRLQLAKLRDEKTWTIILNIPAEADISEGIELTVDTGEPMRVPPEFLEERGAGRAMAISTKLTEVVLPELKKGEMLTWRYTLKSGKQAETTIPVKGLAKVLAWDECMSKALEKMATGK